MKGTAMGTNYAPTYPYLSMGYHEIKVYSIISQSYASASKHFQTPWLRYLDKYQLLLKVNLIKPSHLPSILKQINIQFIMEKIQTRLPFLDVMIKIGGTKTWIDIYNKPTNSKRYVPFTSNHPRYCLTNVPFSLVKIICTKIP